MLSGLLVSSLFSLHPGEKKWAKCGRGVGSWPSFHGSSQIHSTADGHPDAGQTGL